MRAQSFVVRFVGVAVLGVLGAAGCRSSDNPAVLDFATPDGGSVDAASKDLASTDLSSNDLAQQPDMYAPLFGAPTNYAVDSGPIFLASGDVNGDGVNDIVVVSWNEPNGEIDGTVKSSTLTVLVGSSTGVFTAKTPQVVGDYPFSVAIAEVTGDTHNDLIVTNYAGFESFAGNGDGTFGAASIVNIATGSPFIRGGVIGDVDKDGHRDIVVIETGDTSALADNGAVWVSLGDGAGSFATPVRVAISASTDFHVPIAVRLGQMDGDAGNLLDIVTANISGSGVNTVSILTNQSTAGHVAFTLATELPLDRAPHDLLVGDFDSKNKSDIAVVSQSDSMVEVWLSNAGGSALTFSPAVSYPVAGLRTDGNTQPTAIASADIDSDQQQDFIVCNSNDSSIEVLYGDGTGAFAVATASRPGSESYLVGNDPISLVAAPFNSDAKVDIATANQNDANVSVLLNQR